MLKNFVKFIFLFFVIIIRCSYADSIQSLEKFLHNNTIGANFTQTLYGKKKNRVTIGVMKISRPNKFIWQYDGQDGQLIVSNGKNIYVYDELLRQVTIKKLTHSLGKSPALLLAGGNDIKKYYIITKKPDSDGVEWVSLVPLANKISDNNGFKIVEIGFDKKNHLLLEMKFTDGFDNKSRISFTNVQVGINYPPKLFIFSVPKGVDIINADD